MRTEREMVYVYDDFSFDEPALAGVLYVNSVRGGESYSFEYNKEWLNRTTLSVDLDPGLMLTAGMQYSSGSGIFGFLSDASPDRWGRILINKRERIFADREGRKPRRLTAADYLLGVYDAARMGGLRFKTTLTGAFVSEDSESSVPPWTSLRTLEEASRNLENDDTGFTEKWLNPETDAEKLTDSIITIVGNNWRRIAGECGLTRAQADAMRPAFHVCEINENSHR